MRLNWGAITVGGLAGLAAGAVLSAILLVSSIADASTFGGQASLLLIAFITQVLAGFVAARFAGAGTAPASHGAVAALALYSLIGVAAITTGSSPSAPTLAFGASVALVLGTAGGVLAAAVDLHKD